jgi:hypothetical protein
MSAAAIVAFGYLGTGLLVGSLLCTGNFRFYAGHPSSRLLPADNAVCDFLFRSLFAWPWFLVGALGTKPSDPTRNHM